MNEAIPSLKALKEVSGRLQSAHIEFALGGSGLLRFFGFPTDVNDWDLTTDALKPAVERALAGLEYRQIPAHEPFVSEFLFQIQHDDSKIDLIGGFAIQNSAGLFRLPTRVTQDWDGVPVGDRREWARAYELLGRHAKAEFLSNLAR